MTADVVALWKQVAGRGDMDVGVFKSSYQKLAAEDPQKEFVAEPYLAGKKPITDIDSKKTKEEKIEAMELWAKDFHMKGDERMLHHLVILKNLHDGSEERKPRYVAKTHLKPPSKKEDRVRLAIAYEREADIWAERHQKP
jgi:hypothetical protein